MPRWRPLPEELDPQIREFTSQLRRVVERSGMSVATIADRTGYSKSSWERYLGGRLLPPRGATHALGEVTGTDIRHLETMWELAERAWSRDEMRHDVTMEAIRVAQAREALGEFWDDEPAKGRKWGRNKDRSRNKNKSGGTDRERDGAAAGHDGGLEELPIGSGAQAGAEGAKEKEEEWKERTGENSIVRADGLPGQSRSQSFAGYLEPPSSSTIGDVRNSAASAPSAPAGTGRPPMDDETAVLRPRPLPGQGSGTDRGDSGGRTSGRARGAAAAGVPAQRVDVASWGSAGERPGTGPAHGGKGGPGVTEPPRPGGGPPPAYPGNGPAATADPGTHSGDPDGAHGPDEEYGAYGTHPADGDGRSSRGRRIAAAFGGALAVFAVLGVGVLVFGLPGGTDNSSASPKPSAKPSAPDLPAGIKCQGDSCSGKDPEKMGCGGQNVKSGNSQFVGPSMVEVRYSEVCKAAWGRITGAAQGDSLKISVGDGQAESDKVGSTNDAYTEMVAVESATEARACATLVAGTTGCTKAGSAGAADTSSGTAGTAGTADTGSTGDAGDTGGAGEAADTGAVRETGGTGGSRR